MQDQGKDVERATDLHSGHLLIRDGTAVSDRHLAFFLLKHAILLLDKLFIRTKQQSGHTRGGGQSVNAKAQSKTKGDTNQLGLAKFIV